MAGRYFTGSRKTRFSCLTLCIGSLLVVGQCIAADPDAGQGDAHAHHHHQADHPSMSRMEAFYSVPPVTLIDQHGQTQPMAGVLATEKPVLLNFIFTTCTAICPAMSATFQQLQRELGDDADRVLMISVSIDPEQDTPQALADYAQRFGAGPQWVFLTGTLDDSIAVQKAFEAYRGDKMNHAPLTLLRASPEAPWIRIDGFANTSELVKETRAMIRS